MSTEEPTPDFKVTPRLIVGLAIMIAGLVLALDSLGLADANSVLRFWPLVLIAVGVAKWLSTPHEGGGGAFWIVAGLGFLLVTLGYLPISRIWALLLFFVGANIAWRALRPPVSKAAGAPDVFDMIAVLGGTKTGPTAPGSGTRPFRGGRAMAVMGGCEIDLRRSTIPDGQEAVVDVFAMWGGIEIKVPEDWEVVNKGTAILGGIENKTRPLPGASKRLVVSGMVIMGGVEVKN